MPGGDRTGPMGMGPMTGRAAGYCAGYSVPGFMNPIPGAGYGGRGFRGGGRGRRNWFYATGMPGWARASQGLPAWGGGVYPAPGGGAYPAWGAGAYPAWGGATQMPPEQELQMLQTQAKQMREMMDEIGKRIQELETEAKTQKK